MEVDGTVNIVEDIMSTLVSLHTNADAFQLSEYNKARGRTTPGGKLARFFTRAETTQTSPLTLDQMLRHQLEPLPTPLLRTSVASQNKALKLFAHVLRFSEDRCLTMTTALETAQKLLQIVLRHVELRDELYMQLFKQTRGNNEYASRLQLWQLFHILASTVPPSKDYISLLSHYIHETANDNEGDDELKDAAMATLQALKRSVKAGPRQWLPSLEEIRMCMEGRKLKSVVYFLDDSCEDITYDISTTVLDVVEQIAQLIHLEHYQSFSLFECRFSDDKMDAFVLLDDQKYVADALTDLGQTESIGRLIFKKRMFRESDESIKETMFLNLCYIQVQHDYLKGYYPVVYDDAAQLCALQLFSEFYDALPGDDKVLKTFMEKFTIRDIKRMRTREEWKADVLLKFTSLKCTSVEMARYAFLCILRSLPYGQSIFFHVDRLEDPIGLLPPKLVLGINNKGVHFFRPFPKEYLHTVELRDVMQFGSSQRAVFFKMRVAGVLHVFQFETRRGEDICMAVQTHINDIMVKRYATLPPTGLLRHERSMRTELEKSDGRLMELQRDIDRAIQKQQELTRRQGRHIHNRDRDVGHLQDTLRRTLQLQKQKTAMVASIDVLQSEIITLESQLEEIENAVMPSSVSLRQPIEHRSVEARPDVLIELERAKWQAQQLKMQLHQMCKDRSMISASFSALEETKLKEVAELQVALFDATSDGRSQLNLENARIDVLETELSEAREALHVIQSEMASVADSAAELSELKMLKAHVDQRDRDHADIIDRQQRALTRLEKMYKREQLSRKKFYNKMEDMKGKIRVYARVRRILPTDAKPIMALHFPDEVTVSHQWKREDGMREYVFDGIFQSTATQMDVFEGTKDLIQSAVDGYNVCVFAYGQTGSGKTHTIYGRPEEPGLTPRGIHQLFDIVDANADRFRFSISCYMLELYQDSLKDLLIKFKQDGYESRSSKSSKLNENMDAMKSNEKKLEIKRDHNGMVTVHGATVVDVRSAEELIQTFEDGLKRRRVASTELNIASSRSHLIMSVFVESIDLQTQSMTKGKLSFVDLAGSERNKKSGSSGEQLKEAQTINRSLSALGDVIAALAQKAPYIPYRNHKLTMLMSDSLGGNAKTLMFVTVAPTEDNIDETQNSLQYASRVRMIKNRSNSSTDREVTSLKKRIAFWRSMRSETRSMDVHALLQEFQ